MAKLKKPTCTGLVLAALRGRDDFMDAPMLGAETGCSGNQVSAACHNLRKARAADCIVEPDGHAWWYALPPESDNRSRIIGEIQAEIHRHRKPKPKGRPS